MKYYFNSIDRGWGIYTLIRVPETTDLYDFVNLNKDKIEAKHPNVIYSWLRGIGGQSIVNFYENSNDVPLMATLKSFNKNDFNYPIGLTEELGWQEGYI